VRRLSKAILGFLLVFVTVSGARADWIGKASYYHNPRHGGLIAAHRTLPFGTRLLVTNLGNGRSVTVVVVDRGPFIRNRIIDVSTGAADALGFRSAGLAVVRIGVLGK
jgi:rare lipoprotein A